jgi:PAS domain S-box-containing protein
VLALYRDLTERKAHEAEIERFNRLYAALSQVNQAIVHAQKQDALLQEICRVLIEFGRFRMAWIGRADAATKVIKPVARHGDETGYLDRIQVRSDDSPEGRGPVGCALRENKTQVWSDLVSDPRFAAWWEEARRAGLKAVIALPIRKDGEVFAVLSVYASEPDFFGPKEVELLEEAAMDVGFGLANLQRDEQRVQIEAELRTSELRFRTIFNHAPVGISLTSAGRLILVNAEHARITGVAVEDSYKPGIFGRVSHPEDYARQLELAAKFHRGELGSYTVEKRYLHPDGRVQWAELTSHQYVDPATQQRVIVTIITDIAERKAYEERMQRQLDELRRWHEVTLGREERVMDLKREVNELLAQAGQPPRYANAATGRPAADDAGGDQPA